MWKYAHRIKIYRVKLMLVLLLIFYEGYILNFYNQTIFIVWSVCRQKRVNEICIYPFCYY
ncbi:hypothetical protein CNEO3_1470001 [Clostridium neonatale]|nr:hypothetical protein CNEO3_1470001 [Clostridium neonatale]CAI3683849.1 hypothetical protein CNEO3_580001 [Clostridium neonatale]CAI3733347.1 hypothetical protein CNEO3_610001 [Clostridium neonatale]